MGFSIVSIFDNLAERVADRPVPSIQPGRRYDPSTQSCRRLVSVTDARFPSGRAQVLAWDVVCQGTSDVSTMLCRSALGDFFLLRRSGDQPDVAARIVPLSSTQATAWFRAHRIRFADQEALG
jgi:hypothetical protein